MEEKEIQQQIAELERHLTELPKGSLCLKTINDKQRACLQWREGKTIKSKYIPLENYDDYSAAVDERRKTEKRIRELKKLLPKPKKQKEQSYEMNAVTGDDLRRLIQTTAQPEKRDCFAAVERYLYGKDSPRICSIYGLRRTGKTTLLHQLIGAMTEENFQKTVYIKARKKETMAVLDRDLRKLREAGYRFVFIDEITFLEDFIDTASMLSDVYAAMGMKIVISGTDSLGIWLSSKQELYDRTYLIHTTWIPYKEHARLLGTDDIDKYIEYGGTLRVGETDFDDPDLQSEEVSFRDNESTRRYIDTAICQNIQHSLKCFEDGTRFMQLKRLYEAGELTNAINRIIECMNHRFALEVVLQDFQSNDLRLSRKNFLRERDLELRTDILERIDIDAVTDRLRQILKILNQNETSVDVTEAHVQEIKEYLKALDLIEPCPIRYAASSFEPGENTLIMQPGMRYCQAQALIYSVTSDFVFDALNDAQKQYVREKILNEIRGRMLEEIVLIETKKALGRGYSVFKYQFVGGEYDMVVYDEKKCTCRIYEIKHSTEAIQEQCKHLMNEERCEQLTAQIAPIAEKCVLYRGRSFVADWGIRYQNVSEYLKAIR